MSALLGHAQAARIIGKEIGELSGLLERGSVAQNVLDMLSIALTQSADKMEQAMRDQCSPGPERPDAQVD